MTLAFFKNWLDTAKAILGILIGFGSLTFGIFLYVVSTTGKTTDAIIRGEPPPQRFDWIIMGPVIGLLFLMVSLLYYYRFKTKDTTSIEKIFSYVLFFTQIFAVTLSYCFTFQL